MGAIQKTVGKFFPVTNKKVLQLQGFFVLKQEGC